MDGKSTLTLEAQLCDFQGKRIMKGILPTGKVALPVSSGPFPRQSRRADLTSDPMEGTSQEVSNKDEIQIHVCHTNPLISNKYYDEGQRGSASRQVEERGKWIYWNVQIGWPGTLDPQKYKALVNTSAQCTLVPWSYQGAELICISGVAGGFQQLTVFEAEVRLTGNEWEKHPIVTGPEAP